MSAQGSGPGFPRLKLLSRSVQVRDELEGAIGRGDYKPGDRLPSERELSGMFGVSRVSVREAIRSLEALGLVEVRQGRGTLVTDASERRQSYLTRWLELHRDEVLELLFVRGALDELAAASAAASRDADALVRVREAHTAFATLARSPDATLDDLTALDTAFHSAIAEASGVQLLTDLLRELHLQLGDSRRVGFQARGRRERSAREHATILKAIEGHNQPQARRAAASHIATVRALLEGAPADTPD